MYSQFEELRRSYGRPSITPPLPPTAAYSRRDDPPPGPPADEQGNLLLLPDWKPGQPRPADWPPHIHPPQGAPHVQ